MGSWIHARHPHPPRHDRARRRLRRGAHGPRPHVRRLPRPRAGRRDRRERGPLRRDRHRALRLVRAAGVRPPRDRRAGAEPAGPPRGRLHLELPARADRRRAPAGRAGLPLQGAAGAGLVEALERIHSGEELFNAAPLRAASAPSLDWPGKREGITDRESEILALITQGKSNQEVAALTYLSPNTVKSYIRSIYRKIQVQSRTQAVIWGVGHGFSPDHHRIDHWLGGP
ncbi:response regulator transcription factor [Clavibacter tessellarius]|uniref:helix-turn-helix transcriptional regulator n=1 Tax=Clavibacter tessellarius TaxID=31965 RepID=UPI00324857CE